MFGSLSEEAEVKVAQAKLGPSTAVLSLESSLLEKSLKRLMWWKAMVVAIPLSSSPSSQNPKDDTGSSCLEKLTIEYEVKDEFAANASFVTTSLSSDL
ncbi:hypothetical protein L1987_81780 [Smallanthus sonchifolius]|uniref:Uncharacterized protein n=1 Tax=Smallanthus sonchifolius TaxID=185202 RepID=A0ACB8YSZ6_9ASTR|nr:hypothetical protein L1987_81780 [Smallanthus sonchifolius]